MNPPTFGPRPPVAPAAGSPAAVREVIDDVFTSGAAVRSAPLTTAEARAILDSAQNRLVPLPPSPVIPARPNLAPLVPAGFAPAAPARRIAPAVPAPGRAPGPNPPLQERGALPLGIVQSAIVEAVFGFAFPAAKGSLTPPNILDKVKAAKMTAGAAIRRVPLAPDQVPVRNDLLFRIATFFVAGKVAGNILEATPASAGEEQILATRAAVQAVALEGAAGQRSPLTAAEVSAVRDALGDEALTRDFVSAFDSAAMANARTAAARDATEVLFRLNVVGFAFLRDAVDRRTGFLASFPQQFADP